MGRKTTDSGGGGQQSTALMETIRPELNLEKWTIWQPARSKSKPVARVLTRKIPQSDGSVLTATVRVGYTDHGEPKTCDQLVYYALIKIFEENGRPDKSVAFSLRQIARILRKRWGTNVVDSLTKSLLRLRQTPFTWTNSYFDSATGQTIKLLDTFNILSELRTSEREIDGTVNSAYGLFKFNDNIRRNLLANHTKPVFLDTVLNFKSEIAQMLYTQLDLVMADKFHYERRTKELFEDLNLRGKVYKNLSDRKRLLKRALDELVGIPLTTGVITVATLEKAKEGPDFKAVFKKEAAGMGAPPGGTPDVGDERGQGGPGDAATTDGDLEPQHAVESPGPEEGGAAELVALFYRVFHQVEVSEPSRKELEHAAELVEKYGYERACYVVTYSAREAPKTKYNPRVFGGIMQYAAAAVGEFDARRVQSKPVVRECEYCRPFTPGWRYVMPDNRPRRCTHDPEVESRFENFGAPVQEEASLESVDPEVAEVWSAALEILEEVLGRDAVRTWIGVPNLVPRQMQGRRMVFKPANEIVRGWVEDNFADMIRKALTQASGGGELWEIELEEADQGTLFD